MKRLFSVFKPANCEEDLISGASTSRAAISASSRIEQTNDESSEKRLKTENAEITKQTKTAVTSLEAKLSQFLACVVCFDTTSGAIYQCRNGHIMCETCYVRLLAESCMREQPTRCPLCRIFITRKKTIRCLMAERMAALLPDQCINCSLRVSKLHMKEHALCLCPQRPSQCRYRRIGCKWSGTYDQLRNHEVNCEQAKKPLSILLPEIVSHKAMATAANATNDILLKSFGVCRFFFEDLSMTHLIYNNITHSINFCTKKFWAYDLKWSLKLRLLHPEYIDEIGVAENSGLSESSDLSYAGSYQVVLHARPDRFIKTKYFLIHNGDTGVNLPLRIYEHEFSPFNFETDYNVLPLSSHLDTYRILAKSKTRFRFFMLVIP